MSIWKGKVGKTYWLDPVSLFQGVIRFCSQPPKPKGKGFTVTGINKKTKTVTIKGTK